MCISSLSETLGDVQPWARIPRGLSAGVEKQGVCTSPPVCPALPSPPQGSQVLTPLMVMLTHTVICLRAEIFCCTCVSRNK